MSFRRSEATCGEATEKSSKYTALELSRFLVASSVGMTDRETISYPINVEFAKSRTIGVRGYN